MNRGLDRPPDSQQRALILWTLGQVHLPDVELDPVEMLDAYAAEVWDEALRAGPEVLNRYYSGRPAKA